MFMRKFNHVRGEYGVMMVRRVVKNESGGRARRPGALTARH